MNTHANKTQETKSQSVANVIAQKSSSSESTFQFEDNRPEAIMQRKLIELAKNSPRAMQLKAIQEMANNSPEAQKAAQLRAILNNHATQNKQPTPPKTSPEPTKKENNTGLPDDLKSGIENLSGYTMDDVKVHYNSNKPAQLQAYAYAQGTDIHVASGQERHLPHEAWHVVQQKQGRVKPTVQLKEKININDDLGLEKEADLMGLEAITQGQHLINEQPKHPKWVVSSDNTQLQSIQEIDIMSPIYQMTWVSNRPNSSDLDNLNLQIQAAFATSMPIQRKIDEEFMPTICFPLPDDKVKSPEITHEQLQDYAYNKIINSRGQTFEKAVVEGIRLLGPANTFGELLNKNWNTFQEELVNIKDVNAAIILLENIATNLNEGLKTLGVTYPNRSDGHGRQSQGEEAAFTIPQSSATRKRATDLHDKLVEMSVLRNDRVGDENKDEDKSDATKTKETGYMIGVVETINGRFYATCSGGSPWGFADIVKSQGMIFIGSILRLEEAKLKVKAKFDKEGRVLGEDEVGGVIGTCAAPKLLLSLMRETEEKPFAMTEILVAPFSKPTPIVLNEKGKKEHYKGREAVPSCLSCQLLIPRLIQEFKTVQHEFTTFRKKQEDEVSSKEKREEIYLLEELNSESEELISRKKALEAVFEALSNMNSVNAKKVQVDLFSDLRKCNLTDNLNRMTWHLDRFLHLETESNTRKAVTETIDKIKNAKQTAEELVEALTDWYKEHKEYMLQ